MKLLCGLLLLQEQMAPYRPTRYNPELSLPLVVMSQPPRPERNHTLDGLRGLAALLVVFRHMPGLLVSGALLPASLVPFERAMGQVGAGGVCVFFMISGCLILQSLLRLQNVRRFLINRALRIYPVFVPLHLLFFTVGPLVGYEWMSTLRHDPWLWARRFAENLLFLPGVFPLPLAQKAAWSLSYEAVFYGIGCFGFAAYAGVRARRFARAVFWGLLFGFCTGAFIWFHPRALFFVAGVMVYFLQPWLARVHPPRVLRESGPVWMILMFVTLDIYPVVSAAFGMLGFATLSREWGIFASLLRRPWFQWLGLVSYSLYLMHPVALAIARALASYAAHHGLLTSPFAPLIIMVLVGLPLSLIFAQVSYQVIEVWFTNRFLRHSSRPNPLAGSGLLNRP